LNGAGFPPEAGSTPDAEGFDTSTSSPETAPAALLGDVPSQFESKATHLPSPHKSLFIKYLELCSTSQLHNSIPGGLFSLFC
jgi:hypothetical protein